MSDLNSVFDVHFGWPNSSALSHDFPPKDGVTLPAGTIVTTGTTQLRPAVVLRMKTFTPIPVLSGTYHVH